MKKIEYPLHLNLKDLFFLKKRGYKRRGDYKSEKEDKYKYRPDKNKDGCKVL